LHSRCAVIEFKIESKEKQEIAASFFKRVTQILKQENVEFEPKVVAEVITKYYPDYRRILNELQRYSVSGKIDSGILFNVSQESFTRLVKLIKERDFTEVRKWVGKNSDMDSVSLFRELYDAATTYLEPESVPQLVLTLAEYQYRAAFVADHELNTMAALTELMRDCKFK
jgi:DNA polymerase III delta prime subunit